MSKQTSSEIKGDILIVDDDLANLRVLSNLLSGQGYQVRSARDGETALMIASAEPPDLILLDIRMPGMDGYQVCEHLKRDSATQDIPVIFISALDEVDDVVRGFDIGGVDYITKPFNAAEVGRRVETHVALFSVQREVEQRNLELRASQNFLESSLDALSATIAILDESGVILSVNDSWRDFADQNRLGWGDYAVGRNYLEVTELAVGEHDQKASMAAVGIREVIQGQRNLFQLEYPCHSPEVERWFVMRVTRFVDNQDMRVVISHEDITARKRTEKELQYRLEELYAINYITQILVTSTDPLNELGEIAKTVANLFSAKTSLFVLPEDNDSELNILAGYERNAGQFLETSQTFPLSDLSITSQVLASGETDIISDLPSLSMPGSVRAHVNALDLNVFVLIPFKVRGEVIGLLAMGFSDPERRLSSDEVALAETIAGDIASVIENIRLAEQARLAAVDAERQRLARELHDSVTQSLYSLTLLSSGWKSMAEQGTLENPADSFEQLGDVGQQALREMRLLIHQLRPSILDEVGLVLALQQRLDSVESRANIESRLLMEGEVEKLPPILEEQIFHIAQEALNNSLRHAHATEVLVQIKVDEDRVVLSVEDNGKGFDPDGDSAGMGLMNMRERAESIKGKMEIISAPGQGTNVTVSVPLIPQENV